MVVETDATSRASMSAAQALRRHALSHGKVQMMPKCAIRGLSDFADWYTPGVAAPCLAIRSDPSLVDRYTNRSNTVAIVSDGTRVLGLGDIGPEAAMPVMEGKALLFKYLGGVDAIPICLRTKDPAELVRTVKLLEPSFGGINLEDIAQPKCFRILESLRAELTIPLWHDDQQGTATVVLAALINALRVVKKELGRVKVALIGMGAANVATYRLLKAEGMDPAGVIACDSRGTLHTQRSDIEQDRDAHAEKWHVCCETNVERVHGGIAEALRGADVCVAFSRCGPGTIQPEWIRTMNRDAIVFACANPTPEISPHLAREAGARVVGTGGSNYPNQVNNALAFPAIFRGALDVQARTISDDMALAAAHEIARCAAERGIREDYIVPRLDEWDVYPRVAVATAFKAQQQGLARLTSSWEDLYAKAQTTMNEARTATQLLLREKLIPVDS